MNIRRILALLVKGMIISSAIVAMTSCEQKGYITASGSKLHLDGKEWYLYGGSVYQSGGMNWKSIGFRDYMEKKLQKAVEAKLNTIRVLDFIHFDTTDPFEPVIWENVDFVIRQAGDKGLKVVLDLSTYRNLLKKEGKMPYDMDDWNEFLDFVGKRYANNNTIAYYALAGEPDAPKGSEPLRPTTQQLTDFYTQASARLSRAAPNQLISSGGLSYLDWDSGIDWKAIFSAPDIDIAAVHIYSEGDVDITLPEVSQWCKENNKPLINEEFGKQQSIGDADRSAYYRFIFDKCKQYQLAGVSFWNLGHEIAPQSYDINENTPLTWKSVQDNSPLAKK